MSETTGRAAEIDAAAEAPVDTTSLPNHPISTVRESYAFACMRCGHGWEQSYDIEHFVDGQGNEFVLYKVDGRRVPSPLSRPTCLNCGGHVVRFMRAGRVSTILDLIDHPERLGWSEKRQQAEAESLAEESEAEQSAEAGAEESAGATAESEGATAESEGAAVRGSSGAGAAPEESGHHWHLSDLLHPFKGKRS